MKSTQRREGVFSVGLFLSGERFFSLVAEVFQNFVRCLNLQCAWRANHDLRVSLRRQHGRTRRDQPRRSASFWAICCRGT